MGRRSGDIEKGGEARRCGVGGEVVMDGWPLIHVWRIKIRRDALGAGNPSPRLDHTAQGSSTGKIHPHNC